MPFLSLSLSLSLSVSLCLSLSLSLSLCMYAIHDLLTSTNPSSRISSPSLSLSRYFSFTLPFPAFSFCIDGLFLCLSVTIFSLFRCTLDSSRFTRCSTRSLSIYTSYLASSFLPPPFLSDLPYLPASRLINREMGWLRTRRHAHIRKCAYIVTTADGKGGVQRDLVANILLFVRESVGKSGPDEGCQAVPLSLYFFLLSRQRDDTSGWLSARVTTSIEWSSFPPFFFLLSLTRYSHSYEYSTDKVTRRCCMSFSASFPFYIENLFALPVRVNFSNLSLSEYIFFLSFRR